MTDVADASHVFAKPAHVPDALVYDFDYFHDPALVANPHERIAELVRNAPPIFWNPRHGGAWMLMSHFANFNASRDWETFTNQVIPPAQIQAMMASLPPGMPHIPSAVPINLDPPDHTKYRVPLQAAFSPKAMSALQDSIRALACQLIDKVAKRGSCEFMSEIAEPLPVQVFLKMMGLPLERQAEYRKLVREHLGSADAGVAESIRKLQRVAAVMHDTFIERRDNPKDDLISLLWKIEIDGKPTTMDDMENYGVLLFIAGLDTVMNGMGFGIRHLAQDPAAQSRLRNDRSLIPDGLEELLRRYSFTVPPRRVARDVLFEGVQMKENDRVVLFLPAADLDPKEFPEPERFDLDRENKVHIAFNSGPHRCLGSHLARVELRILYEEMLSRLPEFRLDPAHPPRFHGGHVIGVDSLNLLWDS